MKDLLFSRFPAAFVAWKDEEGVVQVTATHYSDGDFTEWVEEMVAIHNKNGKGLLLIVNGSIGDSLLTLDSNEALLYICNSQEELDKALAEAFSAADAILVRCVEAVHINQEGDESCPYTWEVPQEMEIAVGDTLVVESHVGSQHTVVVATTKPYFIQRYTATGLSVDSDTTHPYCAVVHNCGKL